MIPPRLLKTWAIALALIFLVATTLFAALGTPRPFNMGGPVFGWLDPVIAGAMVALSTTPLAFVFAVLRSGAEVGPRFDDTKCPDCEYDLTGLDSDRCPECGSLIASPAPRDGHVDPERSARSEKRDLPGK